MTYDTRERSVQDGAPIELYEFTRGTTASRFTSADADFTLLGNTYTSETLLRSQIETSAERARNAITIECRREFEIAELFRVAPPTEVIGLVVKRTHRADADVAVIWTGRVLNCEWSGARARLNCEPVHTSLRRPGLRRLYQRQCPHVLYRQGPGQCNVNRAAHSTVTTATAISGLVLSVAALASKPWAGGFVEWAAPGGVTERRFIESFSGLNLTLSQAFNGLQVGDTVTVSPGCDHTTSTCSTVYANLPNYGGMPFIPRKNPFDGTPVY
jgi:uncharacterized phage protein (TIGR02218 family)